MIRDYWVLVHFAAISGLALYGLHRIWLLSHWYREKRLESAEPLRPGDGLSWNSTPFVTVQLPLYNERFVAARLLDAAAAISGPGTGSKYRSSTIPPTTRA